MVGSSRRHGPTGTSWSSVVCLLLTVACAVLWSAQPGLAQTSPVSSSPGSSAVLGGLVLVVGAVRAGRRAQVAR